MNSLYADLIPLLLGALLAPVYPIVVLLLLQSQEGLLKSTIFVIGALAIRLVQGIVVGLAFGPAVEAESDAGMALIGPLLLMVAGILLLVLGVKKWLKVSSEEDDETTPVWMSRLTGVTTVVALGWGAAIVLLSMKQWVFTLSTIALLKEAQLPSMKGFSLYLLYSFGTQALVLPPILAFAVAPERTAAPLQSARTWLQKHNRVILIVVSLTFGIYFTYKGIVGLLVF